MTAVGARVPQLPTADLVELLLRRPFSEANDPVAFVQDTTSPLRRE